MAFGKPNKCKQKNTTKRTCCCENDEIGKGICGCMSTEHGDNELELGPDDILVDGLIKKGIKNQGELEVAIGDGMEFTIHGDLKSKNKKTKTLLNNAKVINTIPFFGKFLSFMFVMYLNNKIEKTQNQLKLYFVLTKKKKK